jgi:hypothetical protein
MPPASNDGTSQAITPNTDYDPAGLVHSTSTIRSHVVYQTHASECPASIQGSTTRPKSLDAVEFTGVSGFKRLPYEILSYIVQELSLETIFDLAQTCHHFQYLMREVSLCKMLLKVSSDSSSCPSFADTIVPVEGTIFSGIRGCGE